MKTLRIRGHRGHTLGAVVDYIFERKPGLPDKADTFELVEDAKTEAGSGDHAIVEIVIRYENPDAEDLEDIREIVAIAHAGADSTEITVTEADE